MFIERLLEKIWEKDSILFHNAYNEANKMTADTLFNLLKDKLKMNLFSYYHCNLNNVKSLGCIHHYNKGKLAGCSMCNYHGYEYAYLYVLREKDPSLYAKIVCKSFTNVRGTVDKPMGNEVFGIHNFLCDFETPHEMYEEIFKKNNLFSIRPYMYVFEARADSVTEEKVKELRKYSGNARITIGIGVEVADDWIRNHWLNKKTTKEHIENAVRILNKHKIKASVYILLGIPLLTEEQSIDLFINTVTYVKSLDIDHFTVIPLNRPNNTLQWFGYKHLKKNKKLKSKGLINKDHTGLPWLFSIVRALKKIVMINPEITKKLYLAQYSPQYLNTNSSLAYNNTISCHCNVQILDGLKQFNTHKDNKILFEIEKRMKKDKCYKSYLNHIEKQKKAGNIKDVIYDVSEELAKAVWRDDWNSYCSQLKREIASY